MRVLVLNADYPLFLRDLYARAPGLSESSYAEQMQARNDSLFGVADFYSLGFRGLGHDAREIHVNNDILQQTWAREHGLAVEPLPETAAALPPTGLGWEGLKKLLRPLKRRLRPGGLKPAQAEILRAQIEDFAPDLILNQDMDVVRSSFLAGLRRPGRVIVGQIASQLPSGDNFNAYDLVISSLPNFVRWFRNRGVRSELNRLAFDAAVLKKMGPPPSRDIDVSFVGSLSTEHADRILLLEKIAALVPLKIWGNGIERVSKSSPLHAIYQGQVWGRDMYDVLRRSRITINHHIDLAGNFANNMRLYEATGAGAMLLTDAKENLAEIFAPDREVATYRTAEECAAQIRHYLDHEQERARIADAGQRRTLTDHTYAARAAQVLSQVSELEGQST